MFWVTNKTTGAADPRAKHGGKTLVGQTGLMEPFYGVERAMAHSRDAVRDSTVTPAAGAGTEAFSAFMQDAEPRLRRALVAHYGPDVGRDAAAEALAYAWMHWGRVREMVNPVGYVFRIGQNQAKRRLKATRRREVALPIDPPADTAEPWCEPGLGRALRRLSAQQRGAVILVKGYGWTYEEAARAMQVRRSTVEKHVTRGMAKLRRSLGVPDAA
jgi:RNA polymerase sigma factor (sigma-70 family)